MCNIAPIQSGSLERGHAFERVLFVDDDAPLCRSFSRRMKKFGFQVDIAGSATAAMRLAERRRYPVVVTDLRMPGVDGMTMVERLRPMNPETLFVLVTGESPAAIEVPPGIEDVIAGVFPKPWNEPDLVEVMRRATREAAPGGRRHRRSILLLEDDPGDAVLIRRQLARFEHLAGARIDCVTTLAKAVTCLHDRPYETILSDLSLPDAHGLDTVRTLRNIAPESAIVVLTGASDDGLALRAIQLGAQDYIDKNELSDRALQKALVFANERAAAAQRLAHLAYYDQLTGLCNRTMFRDRLQRAIARASRSASQFALVYVDLDGFKAVNDNYGHNAGDELLQAVASRLSAAIRPGDTVARLGGDEFALILEETHGAPEIEGILDRLRNEIARPVEFLDDGVRAGASFGVATFPDASRTGDELLELADRAMYRAKAGRKR